MKLTDYNHTDHRPLVEEWLSYRGIPIPPRELSSPIGLVIDNKAIGFLYLTQAKRIAYLDQFVTKPGLPSEVREACLQTLIHELTWKAKENGVWLVTALCGSPNMQNRFYRQGFVQKGPYTLIYKTLKENLPCHG